MLVAAGATALFPAAVVHVVGGNQVSVGGAFHFWAVGAAALVATLAGLALSYTGWRKLDTRAVLVGTAFTVMASLLVLHGFATPYYLVGDNGVVALTGAATLPVGGAILALSALPLPRSSHSIARLLVLQGALLVGVLALGVIALRFPSLVPSVPEPGGREALTVLAIGLLFYVLLGVRALRTVLLARRRADILVFVGVVWLAASLPPALLMDYRDLGWWIGHLLEVLGVLMVGAPVAADLFRASPSRPLQGDLRAQELVAAEEAYLGSQVSALTRLLAEKDAYTEGHTRRVALLAVQVGERLGLTPNRLRELAIGALLHDIGKLSVADAILKKPGPLEAHEYAVVRRHAGWGDSLLGELGFNRRIRRLVRDHHERLDGTGYPNGSAGAELDLATRVLAACDVYDALLSERVYRPGWTQERSLALLHADAGTKFDPRCIEALQRVLTDAAAGTAFAPAFAPA
jgi:hypothetical protein